MIKVLILDDREDYLHALRGALRKEFTVITAQTIDEAKRLLDASFQVVLIDVRLSEQDEANRDGLVFLRWAKSQYPNIPMMMMSAYSDFDAAVDANNYGANYYLKKPIDLLQLKELIRDFGKKNFSGAGNSEVLQQQTEQESE